jgi:hypothetical protein
MKKTTYVVIIPLLLLIVVGIFKVDYRIEQLEKRYIDRLEPLIKDSLKMHQWYHNWEANYDEKARVRRLKLDEYE